jgi:hypothetical protein
MVYQTPMQYYQGFPSADPRYPPQVPLRTPPQPHVPPHSGFQASPSRNGSFASPTHSRRQSTQPPTGEEDK